MEDIKTAKECMYEANRLLREQIIHKINSAKKDKKLHCWYGVEATDISLKQADEIMEYLMTKGYDVYKQIPTSLAYQFATYTIFWDEESTGKYREKGLSRVFVENKERRE